MAGTGIRKKRVEACRKNMELATLYEPLFRFNQHGDIREPVIKQRTRRLTPSSTQEEGLGVGASVLQNTLDTFQELGKCYFKRGRDLIERYEAGLPNTSLQI